MKKFTIPYNWGMMLSDLVPPIVQTKADSHLDDTQNTIITREIMITPLLFECSHICSEYKIDQTIKTNLQNKLSDLLLFL